MASGGTFHLSVITPERKVVETEARFVALPAHDGEIGILRNRAPLLVELGIGLLRVETPEQSLRWFLDGGFAEMQGNRLTILTEGASRPEDIDVEATREEMGAARALPTVSAQEFEERQKALARARQKLKIAAR